MCIWGQCYELSSTEVSKSQTVSRWSTETLFERTGAGIKVVTERERGLGQDGSMNQMCFMYFTHLRLGRKLKASQDRDNLKVVISCVMLHT